MTLTVKESDLQGIDGTQQIYFSYTGRKKEVVSHFR